MSRSWKHQDLSPFGESHGESAEHVGSSSCLGGGPIPPAPSRPPQLRAVPLGDDIVFTSREVAGVCGADLIGVARGGEHLLGELRNGFQHREPGPTRRPVGNQKRLADQGIQQIEHRVVVGYIESGNRASAFKVESAREHRTLFQQRLLGVVEVVVGPRHRVAQRVVALQPPPRADQQPEPLIETVTDLPRG